MANVLFGLRGLSQMITAKNNRDAIAEIVALSEKENNPLIIPYCILGEEKYIKLLDKIGEEGISHAMEMTAVQWKISGQTCTQYWQDFDYVPQLCYDFIITFSKKQPSEIKKYGKKERIQTQVIVWGGIGYHCCDYYPNLFYI